jgi:hypothetical protein
VSDSSESESDSGSDSEGDDEGEGEGKDSVDSDEHVVEAAPVAPAHVPDETREVNALPEKVEETVVLAQDSHEDAEVRDMPLEDVVVEPHEDDEKLHLSEDVVVEHHEDVVLEKEELSREDIVIAREKEEAASQEDVVQQKDADADADADAYELLPPSSSGDLHVAEDIHEQTGQFESVVVPPFVEEDTENSVTVAKIDYNGEEVQPDASSMNPVNPVASPSSTDASTIKEIIIDDGGGKRRKHKSSAETRNALKKFLGIDHIEGVGNQQHDMPKLKKLLLQRFIEA